MEKLHKTIGLLVFYECVYVGNANRYNLTVACVTRIISFYVRFPAVRKKQRRRFAAADSEVMRARRFVPVSI